jgi:hypothetical protein
MSEYDVAATAKSGKTTDETGASDTGTESEDKDSRKVEV